MIAAALAVVRFVSRHWLPIAIAAMLAFVTAQGVRIRLLQSKNAALVAQVATMRDQRNQAIAVAKVSETARAEERVQASLSFAEQSLRCDARVNQAREAATAIQEIVNGHGTVGGNASTTSGGAAAGTGHRIVGADQLRRVIGQAAGRPADRVPSRGNGAASR